MKSGGLFISNEDVRSEAQFAIEQNFYWFCEYEINCGIIYDLWFHLICNHYI